MKPSLILVQRSSRRLLRNVPATAINCQRTAHDNVGHVLPPDNGADATAGPARTHPSVLQRIGIVGTPSNAGQKQSGVEHGPRMLRYDGRLAGSLRLIGYDVKDYGDVNVQRVEHDAPWLDGTSRQMSMFGAPVINARTGGMTNYRTAKIVEEIVNDGRAVLHLGGDHATAIGSIVGNARAQHQRFRKNAGKEGSSGSIAVLWVDAHADLNTPTTSYTGNLHGMLVGFLLKELAQYMPPIGDVPGFEWLSTNDNAGGIVGPPLSAHNIAFIGLRAVDPAERFVLEKFGIKHYGMQQIDRFGIQHCVTDALNHINPDGTLPLHCSFDIDAIDPYEAPSTGTPELGGMTLREALTLCEMLHESGTLAGFDMVEVNTELGTAMDKQKTLKAALQLVRAAFGYPRHCLYVEELKTLDYIERGGEPLVAAVSN